MKTTPHPYAAVVPSPYSKLTSSFTFPEEYCYSIIFINNDERLRSKNGLPLKSTTMGLLALLLVPKTNTALTVGKVLVVEVAVVEAVVVVVVDVMNVVVVDVRVVALEAVVVSYMQKSESTGYKPMPAM